MSDDTVIDFPLMRKFKPCVVQFDEAGCTEMILQDVLTVWSPWGPYKGHAVDLGYDVNGSLVGIRIWDNVAKRPVSTDT